MNWSDTLKSDLDKLSQLTSSLAKKSMSPTLKEGERRIVTILFLDIQGFTAMSEKLDPEDVQLIIDNTFKILTNEIEKVHGYIDKYEGDRLMALFGSRKASEQDCSLALRAALGMKERFIEINRIVAERGISIGFRIGVNTGLVVTGHIGKGRDQDFTVMGDAVNLASRLETNAPPGEILVSEEVVKTVGDQFLFTDLGKIEVKGKSEPISVFTVRGVNTERQERWERSPFTKRSGYVSRSSEEEKLSAIGKNLETKGEGILGAAIVSSAGYGKSRLIYEFLKSYRNQNQEPCLVVRAGATADSIAPLGIFVDLFRRALRKDHEDHVLFENLRGEDAEEAKRLEPVVHYLAGTREADDRIRSLEPKALQLEIFLAIRFMLERIAEVAKNTNRGPALIVLEDLQWMDAGSKEALEFLAENLTLKAPGYFLLSFRPEYQLPEIVREKFSIVNLTIAPLTEEESHRIIHNVLGKNVLRVEDENLLIQRSGGNPFFIEELIQSLVDDGTLVRRNETWTSVREIDFGQLPDSVNRILLARVDRLEAKIKEVLMAMATIGDHIPMSVVHEVLQRLGLKEGEASERLTSLEEMGFIYKRREEGLLGREYSFRNSLTRDVVYSTLLNHNKKILHGVVARSLETLDKASASENASVLFHHFSLAGETLKAIEYGMKSVEEMLHRYSFDSGIRMIAALKPLLPLGFSGMEKAKSEFRLLEIEFKLHDLVGDRDSQLDVLERMEILIEDELSNTLFKRKFFLYQGLYHSSLGSFQEAIQKGEAGSGEIGTSEGEKSLQMEFMRLLGISHYSLGEYSKALDYYQKGLFVSMELGEKSAEANFYNTIGLIHFNTGRSEEALQFFSRANRMMTEIGDRRGEGITVGNEGLVHWTLGDYTTALDTLTKSHAVFKEIGYKKGQAVTLGNIGVILHKLGQYEAAIESYETALGLRKSIHDRGGEGYDLVNIGVVHLHRAEYDQARIFFEKALEVARAVGSKYLQAESLNGLSMVFRKLGEHDQSLLDQSEKAGLEALEVARGNDLIPAQVKILPNLGRTYLLLGKKDEAFQACTEALSMIEKNRSGVEGAEEDAYIHYFHVMKELGHIVSAYDALERLVVLIEHRSQKIQNQEHRKSFLEDVRQNRYALDEWNRRPDLDEHLSKGKKIH